MNEIINDQFDYHSTLQSLYDQLNNHGLETKESLRLREKIKEFFEARRDAVSAELETGKFSIMVGGSLQAGTADSHLDIDLTIIIDRGNVERIWAKGGLGKTTSGIRGILLFCPDSLRHQLKREVEIELLSVEDVLERIGNLRLPALPEDIWKLIDDIVRVFSPQLYGNVIDDFRRLVISRLASIYGGEDFWNQKVVPQFKVQLIERAGEKKGTTWPEREQRNQLESQRKNLLAKNIARRLCKICIPNFQEMKQYYGI